MALVEELLQLTRAHAICHWETSLDFGVPKTRAPPPLILMSPPHAMRSRHFHGNLKHGTPEYSRVLTEIHLPGSKYPSTRIATIFLGFAA